jgi:hypothetical protein
MIAKAAVRALALNGGGSGQVPNPYTGNPVADANCNIVDVPVCPNAPLPKYHAEDVCCREPPRPGPTDVNRQAIYEGLKHSGTGAMLVPNQETVICPLQVQSLENPSAISGFDTNWILENTASTPVVVAWVVNGEEWSPFEPDKKPMDDPKNILKPGEWVNVPTLQSFVYHVREIDEDGNPGRVILQHREGLISIGNLDQLPCAGGNKPDVEPVNPETGERAEQYSRTLSQGNRRYNPIDVGFRNQAGCPLDVYWANQLIDVPTDGFSCGEKFKFHLGTKAATQDFLNDWGSATKFEVTFIGHTFVARLASDPNVVVDSYTIQTIKVVDCPNLKQQVSTSSRVHAEAMVAAEGTVLPLEEQVGGGAPSNLERTSVGSLSH